MDTYIMSFRDIDKTKLMDVGGKALNLGELSKIEGIKVPDGFCLTTEAFRKSIKDNTELKALIEKLNELKSDDRKQISEISRRIRLIIENLELAKDIENEIAGALSAFGKEQTYAVRSSATAEDLPNASFAGQQDTYLNISGKDEVLRHVIKCWASLFTDRAVTYRIQNRFDNRKALTAVVIQRMVLAEASGVMFTADPMTSDRKTLLIDAGYGLGEALVSGHVNPDTYKIRDGIILSKRIGSQMLEIRPGERGGTKEFKIEDGRGNKQVLSDKQILSLDSLGKKIENIYGFPQDIEWCLVSDQFYIVQSRPVTTLFPIPASKDKVKHVYMSMGHMQVMTDPILPLGMSLFQLASLSPVDRAGGRLFLDITYDLVTSSGRRIVLQKVDNFDPIMATAMRELMARKDYLKSLPKGKGNLSRGVNMFPWLKEAFRIYRKNDRAILTEMIERREAELINTEKRINTLSGNAVFEFILQDKRNLQAVIFDATCFGAVLICQFVSSWLNKNIEKWLGEKNVTNVLSKSVANNITSEMGFDLCRVADIVRIYPEVWEYFGRASDDNFFNDLPKLQGGLETSAAINDFLDRYGMRCSAEIDITKPRWYEKPTQLIPMILNDVKFMTPGQHIEKFEEGKRKARAEEEEILQRLSKLPGGSKKAKKTKKMISLFRNFIGTREYPKYFWICRYAVYKRALMREADKLAAAGIIGDRSDVYYLYLDEFQEAVKTNSADKSLIEQRKKEYAGYAKLTPPRIIMSDGEVLSGEYENNIFPEGVLVGIPVSSGVIEGRARVVEKLEDAHVEKGDILVTSFTDPSWTPIFVSIAGLITEVGGMMSHGAVITREYGLPAIVGVENATKLIKDGQRIRLNGTKGYVEVL